jgi:hypothetical protein
MSPNSDIEFIDVSKIHRKSVNAFKCLTTTHILSFREIYDQFKVMFINLNVNDFIRSMSI